MNRVGSKMRAFAKRLIDDEIRGNSDGAKTPPAFLVCEKLRPHLATLMGSAGFRSLLSRALALTNAQGDWLRDMHVNADGSLNELDETGAKTNQKQIAVGGIVLVTQLLELLEAFVGENLTIRLVSEVWPKLSLNDLNPDDRGKK